jgi:hypothetical protein
MSSLKGISMREFINTNSLSKLSIFRLLTRTLIYIVDNISIGAISYQILLLTLLPLRHTHAYSQRSNVLWSRRCYFFMQIILFQVNPLVKFADKKFKHEAKKNNYLCNEAREEDLK